MRWVFPIFTDRDYDPFPPHQGAKSKRDRHHDLDPCRDELGGDVELALEGMQDRDLFLSQIVFLILQKEPYRFGGEVHVLRVLPTASAGTLASES